MNYLLFFLTSLLLRRRRQTALLFVCVYVFGLEHKVVRLLLDVGAEAKVILLGHRPVAQLRQLVVRHDLVAVRVDESNAVHVDLNIENDKQLSKANFVLVSKQTSSNIGGIFLVFIELMTR
jgi:hypothetical protein